MELGKVEIRSQKELVSDFSRMLVLQVVSDTGVLNATWLMILHSRIFKKGTRKIFGGSFAIWLQLLT